MKFVVAMDSFKGSMSSLEAGQAVKNGILRAYKKITPDKSYDCIPAVKVIPIADGGEGTVEALTYNRNVKRITISVTGPLGEKVKATYIIVDDNTAIIEMAQAAGLTLVPDELRNPMNTTTYGVGELINHAIGMGCRKFIVGIGGSATNDCGIGMLQALGFGVVDIGSENVRFGANGLKNAAAIIDKNVNPHLKECEFIVACDVDNPLVGERGCSAVFSPQKGATPKMVEDMDVWMNKFADIAEYYVNQKSKKYTRYTPGAGAAGGLGYAFLMFLGGKLLSGAEIVMKWTELEQEIIGSNYVITGEGKLDNQSSMGKIPIQIVNLAKKYEKRSMIFAGIVEGEYPNTETYQIDSQGMNIEESMITENACYNLEHTVEAVIFNLLENDNLF